MRLREYEAGQVIFSENDRGETAYVIETGRVEVLKTLNGQSVHLAYIEAGEPFGEMSLIDEKPRSATIVAVARTTVREFHRDDFMHNLQLHPEFSIRLLQLLFERLREANATILEMHLSGHEAPPHAPAQQRVTAPQSGVGVVLEGLTPQARSALPLPSLRITRFPFRVGRQTSDALSHNDLAIRDREPFHISRHHLTIAKSGDRISFSDRGSRLGFLVNGQRIGGDGNRKNIVFLSGPEAILILGEPDSPFQFRVTVLPDR